MSKPMDDEERERRFRQRFEKKLERQEDGCLHWTGTLMPNGYGQVRRNGRTYVAHVWSLVHHGMSYDPSLDVGHKCHDKDTACRGGWACLHRRCVEPTHLKQETRSENLKAGRGNREAMRTAFDLRHQHSGCRIVRRKNGTRRCYTCEQS